MKALEKLKITKKLYFIKMKRFLSVCYFTKYCHISYCSFPIKLFAILKF